MYNYFMLIGTLEEDFIGPEGKKPTVKVKCQHAPFNQLVLPVNITRVTQFMCDFMYRGDAVVLKGRIELDSKGNIELLAESLIMFKEREKIEVKNIGSEEISLSEDELKELGYGEKK